MLLSRAAREAQKDGMTGFEFAAGIPGTVGGAAVMNAGAYGGELKDVLESVRVMTPDGEGKKSLKRKEGLDHGLPPQLHPGARIYRFIGADPSGER
ncbi:MAG: FAD-binding protein [Clostridium fessum]